MQRVSYAHTNVNADSYTYAKPNTYAKSYAHPYSRARMQWNPRVESIRNLYAGYARKSYRPCVGSQMVESKRESCNNSARRQPMEAYRPMQSAGA